MVEALPETVLMSAEDYLARENDGAWRHEFLDGAVFAMVGSSDRHNLVCGELYAALLAHLPPRCQPFSTDMKLHVRRGREERFYYPDVFVSCSATDRDRYTRAEPVFVAEVLSEATERIDRVEKFHAYTSIPSLEEYALLSQDEPKLELFRRRSGWEREVFGPDDAVTFESVALSIPLASLYRRVLF